MRRFRFITLFFLALSAAFFCLHEFRWALEVLALGDDPSTGRGAVSPARVRGLRLSAEREKNTRDLAFAVLHWPDQRDEAMRLADQVVAADRSLTWIYYPVALRYIREWKAPAVGERVRSWSARLQEFDPGNAAPALLQAEIIRETAGNWPSGTLSLPPGGPPSEYALALASQSEWQSAMLAAFRKSHYDPYHARRFDLEREVLLRQRWASPSAVVISLAGYALPNLLHIGEFAQLQTGLVGPREEQAGRRAEAAHIYSAVAAFGKRLQQGGGSQIEGLQGLSVESLGSEALLAMLRKSGNTDEAALLDLHLQQIRRGGAVINREPAARTSHFYWFALLVQVFGGGVALFGLLTVMALIYVNLGYWLQLGLKGRMHRAALIAENYFPVILFVCCASLYVCYLPYAQNFQYYMTTREEMHRLEPIFYNIYPGRAALPGFLYLPVEDAFASYAAWALAMLSIAALVAGWQEWRMRKPVEPVEPLARPTTA